MTNKPSFPSKSEELTDSERSVGAGIGGVILGASLGGPFGAVIGGLSGLILADVVNEDKKKRIKL